MHAYIYIYFYICALFLKQIKVINILVTKIIYKSKGAIISLGELVMEES